MKIKHILTLFCVTLTLAFLLVSCAASSEGSNETAANQSNLDYLSNSNFQSNTNWINSITVADVSKENCEHADLSLNCFISVWKTDHGPRDEAIIGVSDTNIVKLPLVKGGTYDFYVDWGDGEEVELITTASSATHTYKDGGEKTIHIAGTIKGWRFFVEHPNFGDAVKLLNVTQWGSLSLGNTDGRQFQGAENFNPTATDAPDLSETTSLQSAFSGASNFNGAIANWDVSKVTYMLNMFNIAQNFNQDISGWDVGKVNNMEGMFYNATNFNNGGLALEWGDKTSNVTDMNAMFYRASDFNQDISEWDVGKVEFYDDFATGSGLITNHTPPKFRGANAVSKEVCEAKPELRCFISVWNTGNAPTDTTVTGYSGTMSVKLPLVNNGEYNFYVDWGDGEDVEKIEAYNADKITHTYATQGEYTIHIAGTIKGWRFFVSAFDQKDGTANDYGDAAKLTDVSQWGSLSLGNTAGRQFQGAQNFNPTATDAPDVSETTGLHRAFNGASNFNGEVGNWDVSKVTDISYMFGAATNFNQDISDWDVREVTSMSGMFNGAISFNNGGKPLDWGDKTSKVTNMGDMFLAAKAFNQDISSWNVSEVTDMSYMFWNAELFDQDLSKWNVCKVANSKNFDAETLETWTQKPNWGMDCPTN